MKRKKSLHRHDSERRAAREAEQGRRVMVSIVAVLVFFMVLAMIAYLLF